MKATLHLPTGNYAYIELTIEGTSQEIVDAYFEVENTYQLRYQEELKKRKDDF